MNSSAVDMTQELGSQAAVNSQVGQSASSSDAFKGQCPQRIGQRERQDGGIEGGMSSLSLTEQKSDGQPKETDMDTITLKRAVESLTCKVKCQNEMVKHNCEEIKLNNEGIMYLHKIIELKDKEIAALRAIIDGSSPGENLTITQQEKKKEVERLSFAVRQEYTNLQLTTTSHLTLQQRIQKLHIQAITEGQQRIEKVCKALE